MYKEWLEKELQLLAPQEGKKRKRQYVHFDNKISEIGPTLAKNIGDPAWVSRYGFFPFIRYAKVKVKSMRVGRLRKHVEGKVRYIDYAAHTDALIYSWYAYQLQDAYEKELRVRGISQCVTAYRSIEGKSNLHFAKEVFDFVQAQTRCTVVLMDIKSFFPSIQHDKLKMYWASLLGLEVLPEDHYKVFRSLTKFSHVLLSAAKKVLGITDTRHMSVLCSAKDFREKIAAKGLIVPEKGVSGIPQGSPMSCVLANVYMLGFDSGMHALIDEVGGIYRRYSDDIFIAFPSDKYDVTKKVGELLSELGLAISEEKTERYLVDVQAPIRLKRFDAEGLVPVKRMTYLGATFDGTHVSLRHAGVARFQRRRAAALAQQKRTAAQYNKPPSLKAVRKKFTRMHGLRSYLSYADKAHVVLESSVIKKQFTEKRMHTEINANAE